MMLLFAGTLEFHWFLFNAIVLFLRYNKIALITSIIIIALCAFPGNKMPSMDFMDLFSFDKMAHLFCFGLLCFFCVTGLVKYLHFSYMRKHALNYAVAYCVLLGGATELTQAMLAIHRSGDWIDFLADCLGIFFGAVAYIFIYKKNKLVS